MKLTAGESIVGDIERRFFAKPCAPTTLTKIFQKNDGFRSTFQL